MGMMSEADHKIVSDAVAAAELHTSGEIVPVIAEESDGYSDIAYHSGYLFKPYPVKF